MKLISLGKINKKIFLIIFLYIISQSINIPIYLFFEKENDKKENLILQNIYNFSFLIFNIIPEYIIKKKLSIEGKKYNDKHENTNNNNEIVYLHSNIDEKMSIKNYMYLIFILFLNYIIIVAIKICSNYFKYFQLFSNELLIVIYIFYFYLIFRIFHKMHFYKHQCFSSLMIIFTDLIKFFIFIFLINKINFDFPYDLLPLIPLIIVPAIPALQFYLIKRYMRYYYLSPFFILFLMGLVFLIISIILLPIFLTIDCGEKMKHHFCEIQETSAIEIIINIIKGILFSVSEFFIVKTIYNFTLFYILIFFSIDTFIVDIMSIISNYNNINLILSIITFSIKIFFISVFIEIIELNFCGFNFYLKKNITKRSKNEINSIFNDEINGDEDNNSDRILEISSNNNEEKDSDTNSVY